MGTVFGALGSRFSFARIGMLFYQKNVLFYQYDLTTFDCHTECKANLLFRKGWSCQQHSQRDAEKMIPTYLG